MVVFIRSTRVIICLLVLSLIVSALPANTNTQHPASRRSGSDVTERVSDLQNEVELIVGTIGELTVVTDVTVFVELLVVKVNTCAESLFEIARNIDIDLPAKVEVAVKIITIISTLFNLSVELVAKFGARLVHPLLANIDACTVILLSVLNICTKGAVSSISNMLGSSELNQAYLKLSASTLDSIGR